MYQWEKVMARGPRGGHQSGTVNYFFRRCFRENLNCGQCINDKQITFCVLKIWDRLSLNHNQNNKMMKKLTNCTFIYVFAESAISNESGEAFAMKRSLTICLLRGFSYFLHYYFSYFVLTS